MKDLKDMKKEYSEIEIPEELDFLVRQTIRKEEKKMKFNKIVKNTLATAAAVAVVFTGAVNLSPKASYAVSNVPVIGKIAKLVTFMQYKHDEEGFNSDIKLAKLDGLSDKELEKSLNEKYLEEGQKQYQEFTKQMNDMKEIDSKHFAMSSDYEIVNENDRLLVIKNTVNKIQASSEQIEKYDNIDKQNKAIISLPSLFKDDKYIELISENVKSQMREQMKNDPDNKVYFIDQKDVPVDDFSKIEKDQAFYINKDGKLVIVFDQTSVAPAYMGVVKFTIPTEVIKDDLAGNGFIK